MKLGHWSSTGQRYKTLKHTSSKSHPQLFSFFFLFPWKASKVNIYTPIKRFSECRLSLAAKICPPKRLQGNSLSASLRELFSQDCKSEGCLGCAWMHLITVQELIRFPAMLQCGCAISLHRLFCEATLQMQMLCTASFAYIVGVPCYSNFLDWCISSAYIIPVWVTHEQYVFQKNLHKWSSGPWHCTAGNTQKSVHCAWIS